MSKWLRILPVVVFIGLAAVFFYQLVYGGPPQSIPSALIGKKVPAFALPDLNGKPNAITVDDFGKGKPIVVNVFASWCPPCRIEHPALTRLAAREEVTLYGIAYKDKPEDTKAYLDELGNPFDKLASDQSGRSMIDWGVYGAPETFVVSADGTILYRYDGEITDELVEREILPRLGSQP
jgi:cytochrome c biogenesis protein CcmG/thiol:disulfide interchange protein DsbE